MEELSMKETLKAGDERKVEEDFFQYIVILSLIHISTGEYLSEDGVEIRKIRRNHSGGGRTENRMVHRTYRCG